MKVLCCQRFNVFIAKYRQYVNMAVLRPWLYPTGESLDVRCL